MSYRPKGKHVSIDPSYPQALGICDKTGFVFNRKDLIRQMEWRGNALVWTGFYVGRCYADTPNEQLRNPILPPDPVPVAEPRLPQPNVITWTQGNSAPWTNTGIESWTSWSGSTDGITALPEATRLQYLQQGIIGTGIGGGGPLPATKLTEAQIEDELHDYHWGP